MVIFSLWKQFVTALNRINITAGPVLGHRNSLLINQSYHYSDHEDPVCNTTVIDLPYEDDTEN